MEHGWRKGGCSLERGDGLQLQGFWKYAGMSHSDKNRQDWRSGRAMAAKQFAKTHRSHHVIIETPSQRPPHGTPLAELRVCHLRHLWGGGKDSFTMQQNNGHRSRTL